MRLLRVMLVYTGLVDRVVHVVSVISCFVDVSNHHGVGGMCRWC